MRLSSSSGDVEVATGLSMLVKSIGLRVGDDAGRAMLRHMSILISRLVENLGLYISEPVRGQPRHLKIFCSLAGRNQSRYQRNSKGQHYELRIGLCGLLENVISTTGGLFVANMHHRKAAEDMDSRKWEIRN